jgi:hypothetical protein
VSGIVKVTLKLRYKLLAAVHASNPSTHKTNAGGLGIPGQPGLQEFHAHLAYKAKIPKDKTKVS